jgi:lipid A 3-O-deacylase
MRIGFTYVGIDTDVGPSAAGELSYLGSTPRFWRAGVIGGVLASTDGAVYGYAGLHLPVSLPLGLLARPSFSVGLYERGGGMELGHALEFRSSIVIERVIADRGVRVSAMLYHLSNAGLGFTNPGLEAVGVAVAVPVWNRKE